MSETSSHTDHAKLLGIYLNDHLMGASVGVELAKRTAQANDGTPFAAPLRELHTELAADRDTLRDVMRVLRVPVSRLKAIAGAVGERAGRLKLNGRLTTYSPLSRVLELEGLQAGADMKLRLWVGLRHLEDPRLPMMDFDRLADRAQSQIERLERLRLDATVLAFKP